MFIYGLYKKHQYLNNEHEKWFNRCDTSNTDTTIETIIPFKKEVIPYEEKYLVEVRNMKNEYVFTDEELEVEQKMLRQLEEEGNKAVSQSILTLSEQIDELKMRLFETNESENQHACECENEPTVKSQKDGDIVKQIKLSLENEIKINV